MQHYLQPDVLQRMHLDYFDNWAATFGNTVSALEIKPTGQGFRMKTRFAEFKNLPELCNTFMQTFDLVKSKDLGLKLPEICGGAPELVVCEKSPEQEELVEAGMERAELIEKGEVEPNDDNMLAICTYMSKVALDHRIIYKDAPEFSQGKVAECVKRILQYDAETPNTAQIVFCDTNTPQSDGSFSVYNALKNDLVATGKYKTEEIAFIHDAATDSARQTMFDKVNSGEIRVIIGSTGKLGTGVNIQNKLVAAHHLDAPYRPADLEQRNGRIVRQGNTNSNVHIVYYSTKGTFDSYRWQLLEKKQFYISQIMSGKPVSRNCKDVDAATLTFAEMKAATTENPLIAEKLSVDNEVDRLTLLERSYHSHKRSLETDINERYPSHIKSWEEYAERAKIDLATYKEHANDGLCVDGKIYTSINEEAGEPLIKLFNKFLVDAAHNKEIERSNTVATYNGFDVIFSHTLAGDTVILKGNSEYRADVSFSALGLISRINNLCKGIEGRIKDAYDQIKLGKSELKEAQSEYEKPFEHSEALKEMLEKQSKINAALEFTDDNTDEKDIVMSEDEDAEL